MRCFHVLVHGRFRLLAEPGPADDPALVTPAGFYCHRYVLAADEAQAAASALRRVRENLDRRIGWIRSGLATLELEAEEISVAPLRKLLKPDNRGHSFYLKE